MKITHIPQDLADRLPLGQIVILTSPDEGLTSTYGTWIQYITQLGNTYGKPHVISSITVEYPELWGCFAYKMANGQNQQVLVADKKSLVEMLCTIWGLDFETIKGGLLQKRYRQLIPNGKSHPATCLVAVKKPAGLSIGTFGSADPSVMTAELITTHTREGGMLDIRSTIRNIFDYDLGISLEDIISIYEAEKKNRKTYRLEIEIKKKEVYPRKFNITDIYLVDNEGVKYLIKETSNPKHKTFGPFQKALYLSLILFEDGISTVELCENETFQNYFKEIYSQLPYNNSTVMTKMKTPDKLKVMFDLYSARGFKDDLATIRDAVNQAVPGDSIREQFAVEAKACGGWKVAGATDEHRALIKKEFGLK